MHQVRCCVCRRVLGLVDRATSVGLVFCPDRLCLYYPPTTTVRAEDPTLPAWVLGVHSMTRVTRAQISRAMNRAPAWAPEIVKNQLKRWQHFE